MVLRNILSERQEELPEGELGKLLKVVVENKDVISLGPGEPDFSPPRKVISAYKKALDKGYTHYSPIEGRSRFLEAIQKKLKEENKINVPRKNIIVTNGSTEALMMVLMCTIDPGDSALVPDPGFITYRPTVELLNGHPLSIELDPRNDFYFDIDKMSKLVEPKKTKVLIINTPSNPTGSVLSKKNLEEIANFAIDKKLLIISDEAYEKFVFKGKHVSIGSLNGMRDYVVTVQTLSKSYAMAGFRLGYAAGPEKIISAMKSLHVYTSLTASTPAQIAAIEVFKTPKNYLQKHISEYNKRRKYLFKRIKELPGFDATEPHGAFYVFPKYDFKMSSKNFAKHLLEKAKVVTIPGTDFGRYGEGFLRFSFATKLNLIKSAMDRIEKIVKKFK